MNTALGAARSIACSGCGRRIQWHRTLHTRMLIGGLLFRLGLLVLLACVLVSLLGFNLSLPIVSAVAAALAAIAIGVFVTYTPASRAFVELVGNDT